jgi:L-alanine-DL-glutamate epimerase-like enolase superfamily enzyme
MADLIATRPVGAPVEGLRVAAYEVPTDEPESDGTLEWESTTIVVVEIEGGGEIGLGYSYADASAALLIDSTLRDVVTGADTLSPPAVWATMQAAVRNVGRAGTAAMAISAVDIALWDLKARLLGVALADALPRFHDRVPVYGSGGFCSYSDRRLRDQLAGWVGNGIAQVKIKVGREPSRDPERLAAAREAIGADTDLFVDANGAYSRERALDWAHRFRDQWGVSYLEEPVSSDDVDGLRLVRDFGPPGLAIAAGEYAWDLIDLARLVEGGAVDVLQADVTRCGGITNFLRADGLCRAHNVLLSAHCAPAVSTHACCGIERLAHLEYFHDHVRLEGMLFGGVVDPIGGCLEPDRSSPGLGLELRRADLDRYAVR